MRPVLAQFAVSPRLDLTIEFHVLVALLCRSCYSPPQPQPASSSQPLPIFAFFFFVCSSNRGDASPTPASPADASAIRDDADASPKTLPIPESVSEPVAVAAAAAADAAGAVDAASVPQTADADAAPSVAAGAFAAADAAAAATGIGVDSPLPSAEKEAPVDGNGDSGCKPPTGAGLGTTELVQVRLFVCGCCCGGGVPGIGGAGLAPNADDSVAPGKSIQQLYLACGNAIEDAALVWSCWSWLFSLCVVGIAEFRRESFCSHLLCRERHLFADV